MEKNDRDILWKEAFARLSEPHWDALLRFAVSLCRSQERAEDLLQMALLRGVRFFQKFCEKNFAIDDPRLVEALFADAGRARHFKNWLYKILKNVYLDDQASVSKWSFDSDEEMLENRADEARAMPGPFEKKAPFSGDAAADPKAVSKEEEAFFSLAADDGLKLDLEVLSDRQRSVLYLIAEEYSYKEVASILNIPIGTVMSTLSRGLSKLRSRMSQRLGKRSGAESSSRKGAQGRSKGISFDSGEVVTQGSDGRRAESVSSDDGKVVEK